MKKKKLVD